MGAPASCKLINDFFPSLEEENLIWEFRQHHTKDMGSGIKRVWWRGSEDTSNYADWVGNNVEIGEYRDALERQDYSFLLNDGGIAQILLDYDGNSVLKYRYAYLPCPISLAGGEADDSEEIDLYAKGEIRDFLKRSLSSMDGSDFRDNLVMVAPLRFEWDRNQDLENEPRSHVHLGVSEGRVAVSHPVSVRNFLHFVFKNFYPRDFGKFEDLQKLKKGRMPEIPKESCIREHEKRHAYISVPNP